QVFGDLPHFDDGGAHFGGDGAVGVAQAGDFGDVYGVVAHAFEVAAHAECGDDEPQVDGDGLLSGHQFEDGAFDVGVEGVDRFVSADDLFGELEVGVQERGGGAGDGGADEPGHFDQLVGEGVEFFVVRVAHAVTVGGRL